MYYPVTFSILLLSACFLQSADNANGRSNKTIITEELKDDADLDNFFSSLRSALENAEPKKPDISKNAQKPEDEDFINDFEIIPRGDLADEIPIPRSLMPKYIYPPTSPVRYAASQHAQIIKVISEKTGTTLSKLSNPEHFLIWNEMCKAIEIGGQPHQCCTDERIREVANLVHVIRNKAPENIANYMTLLEYAIQKKEINIYKMLHNAGITFFSTGYEIKLCHGDGTISSGDFAVSVYHEPPIHTAIMHQNFDAFQLLLPESLNVALEKNYSLQQFIKKTQEELYKQKANSRVIDQMVDLICGQAQSSCVIQ